MGLDSVRVERVRVKSAAPWVSHLERRHVAADIVGSRLPSFSTPCRALSLWTRTAAALALGGLGDWVDRHLSMGQGVSQSVGSQESVWAEWREGPEGPRLTSASRRSAKPSTFLAIWLCSMYLMAT